MARNNWYRIVIGRTAFQKLLSCIVNFELTLTSMTLVRKIGITLLFSQFLLFVSVFLFSRSCCDERFNKKILHAFARQQRVVSDYDI